MIELARYGCRCGAVLYVSVDTGPPGRRGWTLDESGVMQRHLHYWVRGVHPRAAVRATRQRHIDAIQHVVSKWRAGAGGKEISAEVLQVASQVPHEPWSTRRICERDGWMCRLTYCVREAEEGTRAIDRDGHPYWRGSADHAVPTFRGGADAPYNLVAAHVSCNSAKGTAVDAPALEYLASLGP